MPRPVPRPPPGALVRRSRTALGGVAAQVSQALASLVLQVLVARTLGDVGLAAYALLYGGLVLATAVVTGLVGDTLTVVDRSAPRARAGLQWWTAGVALVLGGAAGLVTRLGTDLGPAAALAFAVAVSAFLVEDVLRRLLMACTRFWSVVVVDAAALAGSVLALVVAASRGPLGLPDFLAALAAGQVLACLVAVALLPATERHLAAWRGADLRVVLGFGAWRAAQQVLRPGMLTAARLLVVSAAGAAAYGQLEGARLLATPLALVVSGTGNVLLVSYSRARQGGGGDGAVDGRRAALRRADAAAAALVGLAVVVGAAATAATPAVAPLVTAGAFALEPEAVGAWVLYAATSAVLLPYAVLASVSGLQRTVLLVRSLDSALSLGLVAVLLLAVAGPVWAVPVALSAGSLLSAAVLRRLVGARPGPGAGGPAPSTSAH